MNQKLTHTFVTALAVALTAYMVADLVILKYRPLLIPEQTLSNRPPQSYTLSELNRGSLNAITTRNIFNSKGEIPEAIKDKAIIETPKEEVPQPSSLPLNLLGTLVHSNPSKSLAAIEVKGKNITASFTVGKEIDKIARIEKIERLKVFIRNLSTNALEFIEMNQPGQKLNFNTPKVAASKASKEVFEVAPNTYKIKRDTLNKYLNDLPSVLMQARAVPNKDPVTGEVTCFRLLDIQSGSVFEELRLQRMDCIKSVNGEPVNSVQKAMEMYTALKNGSSVKLGLERNGQSQVNTYNIE
jgi:general secretion pathway protein C